VKVVALHVEVGQLSGVVPEALVSAFELAREGIEIMTLSSKTGEGMAPWLDLLKSRREQVRHGFN
jgi:hypothetical protein